MSGVVRPDTLDLRLLHQELTSIADSEADASAKSLDMIALVMRLTNAAAGIFFYREHDGKVVAGSRYLSKQALTWSDSLIAELAEQAERAMASGRLTTDQLQRNPDAKIITVPVSGNDGNPAALSVLLVLNEQSIENFAAVVSLSAFILVRLLDSRGSIRTDDPWNFARLVSASLSGEALASGTKDGLIDVLATHFCADYAVLGRRIASGFELTYPPTLTLIDNRNELQHAIDGTFDEASKASTHLKFGARKDIEGVDSIVMRNIAVPLNAGFVLASYAGECALLLIWDNHESVDPRCLKQLDAKIQLLSDLLRAVPSRTKVNLGGAVAGLLNNKSHIVYAMIALAALMALPVTYKITADAVLEPVTKRYIVAPFDATLEEAYFKPGDIVTSGTMLAKLDGKDLLLEIEGTVAELEKTRNRRRTAVATGSTSEAQLAQFEIEKLSATLKLLESRRERIELYAAIDGVVLSGDLTRNAGSPLRTGQTLFEIAPLESLVARVQIPAHAIGHVRAEMKLQLRIDSQQGELIESVIDRIRPRAEIIDNHNVFVAEALMSNSETQFKPGMTGRAKLIGERHALGWVLFHRAWQKLRLWLW